MGAESQAVGSPRSRLVCDAMQINVVSAVPEMTVRELSQLLVEHSITGAPVLDRRGKVIGVVSMTDVLQLAAHEAEIPAGQLRWDPGSAAEEADAADCPTTPARPEREAFPFTVPVPGALAEAAFDQYQVRDIMTPVMFSVRPMDTLADAVRLLLRGRIHRALVIDRGVLHGIITPFDVLQALEWA